MTARRAAEDAHRISVVIIAQDDETRIASAIVSCKPFADEIVVIDGGSKDGTRTVAEQLGCRVYENAWPGYAKQRMFGSRKASYDWIFVIDTDEVADARLIQSICECKPHLSDESKAYAVDRIGDFMGRWMGRKEPLVRLYNRKRVQFKDTLVHEIPDVEAARVVKLQGELLHYGFRSIGDHIRRFNRYTDLEAEGLVAAGKPFRVLRLLVRPPARFLHKYFWQGLYRKGIPGLAVAVFWGLYEFLACLKHYELLRIRAKTKPQEETLKEGKAYAGAIH